MTKFILNLRNVLAGERGATAIEYALLVGLIAVIIIAAVTLLGTQLQDLFCGVVLALNPTAGACPA